MKINTTRFGAVTINKKKIIDMPFGMLGFPDKRQFVMLRHKENSPFFWYQSVDEPSLAFVIMSPFHFMPSYTVDVEKVLKEMSWTKVRNDSLELYVVVNIPKGSPDKMTANLIGPILINNKNLQAVQVVIGDSNYSHKFPLIRKN
jgi:flagellar assembly factor FliW